MIRCPCGHEFPAPRPGFIGRPMVFCPKCGKLQEVA